MTQAIQDAPVFPKDLMRTLGLKHRNTLREYIKAGKVPKPDVQLTAKTRYWHRSTLVKAGIVKAEPSSDQESASPPTTA